MLRPFWAALCALALAITPSAAMAARVSPMIVELEPIGRGATTRIEMASDANRDIPYEVLMFRGDISTEGELTLTAAEEDFLVFPTQVILEAGSRQVFRVQYVGEPELAKSEIYYMSIRQIPVALTEQRSQVQVVINYNVLMNIVPDGASSEPAIRKVEAVTRLIPIEQSELNAEAAAQAAADQAAQEAAQDAADAAADAAEGGNANPTPADAVLPAPVAEEANTADEAVGPAEADPDAPPPTRESKGLEVLVGNDGNRYFLAGLSNWKINGTTTSGEAFEAEYTPEQIARFVGAGVVAPGKDRLFFLPMEADLDTSSVTIEIDPPAEQ